MYAIASDLYHNNNYKNNCSFENSETVYNLFVNNKTCSLDLYSYSGILQTKTVLFTVNASSHKTNWITTARCLLCLGLIYAQVVSLKKDLEVEQNGTSP